MMIIPEDADTLDPAVGALSISGLHLVGASLAFCPGHGAARTATGWGSGQVSNHPCAALSMSSGHVLACMALQLAKAAIGPGRCDCASPWVRSRPW